MLLRVVIDANIFISYLLSPDDRFGTIARVFESIGSGRYQLVRSERLISEIRTSVTGKPELRKRISDADLEELIALVEAVSIPLPDHPDVIAPPILRDQKDDYLLEVAHRANADYLVSGDRDLLDIRDQLDRPQIVTPRAFLELMDAKLV